MVGEVHGRHDGMQVRDRVQECCARHKQPLRMRFHRIRVFVANVAIATRPFVQNRINTVLSLLA